MRFRILLLCDPRLKKEEGGAEASGAELAPQLTAGTHVFVVTSLDSKQSGPGVPLRLHHRRKLEGSCVRVFFFSSDCDDRLFLH